jgi:hypothetical protein
MLRRIATPWKQAGIGILLVPIALLLLLAVGEMVGGDPGGLSHLLQAAPLVILALLAWRFPAATGRFLVGVGTGLAVLYLIFPPQGLSVEAKLVAEMLFFAPPMLAGLLLLKAGQGRP